MNCLVTIVTCVMAMLYVPAALGQPYVQIPPYFPYPYGEGGGYLDEDYLHGGNSNYGDGFRRHGSNMFYNEGENHHRTKQVYENEDHSRHNVGGGSGGGAAGGSYGGSNVFGRGGLRTGGRYANFGPRFYK